MARPLIFRRVAPLVLAGAFIACEPNAPLGVESPLTPALNAAAVATSTTLGSYGMTSGYTNSQGLPLSPTGIVLAAGDVAEVTVAGFLHLEVNPARYSIPNVGPPVEPPNDRIAGPAGWPAPNSGQRVVAWIGPEGSAIPSPSQLRPIYLTPLDQSSVSLSGLIEGPGQIWVERNPGPGGSVSCTGDPSICPGGDFQADDWIVVGEQNVSASLISGPYMMASATEVMSGDTVTFTVGATTGNIFSVGGWQWFPVTQSIGISVSECNGSFFCAYMVLESGRMHARVEIGTDLFDLITYVVAGPDVVVGPGTVVWQLAVSVQQLNGTVADALAPRIPELLVNGTLQSSSAPETASVSAVLMNDGVPASGVPVLLRAELLSGTGGHQHIAAPISFTDPLLVASQGPDAGLPVTGHFSIGGTNASSFSVNTDVVGTVSGSFVAGYIGGRVRLIAEVTVGDVMLADTTEVTVRVPGLINAQDVITGVWWAGGSPSHLGLQARHVAPIVPVPLQAIVDGMSSDVLAIGDISLPLGGTFNNDAATGGGVDDPFGSRQAHATGMDVDVGLCTAAAAGVAAAPDGLAPLPCGPSGEVSERLLRRWTRNSGGVMRVHENNHYHVRFVQ